VVDGVWMRGQRPVAGGFPPRAPERGESARNALLSYY
jgi:hypothetical protein